MKKIGYARVSTEDQTLALQHDALRGAGCDALHEDRLSGVAVDRPGLMAALAACKPGDMLHVWKLDRLGRSMSELVEIVDTLKARGVGLKVLTGEGAAIDTTRPEGRLIFGVFAAFSEFERELIRERTKAGMAAARRRGKHVGRPFILTPEKFDLARRLLAEGKGRTVVRRRDDRRRSRHAAAGAGEGLRIHPVLVNDGDDQDRVAFDPVNGLVGQSQNAEFAGNEKPSDQILDLAA